MVTLYSGPETNVAKVVSGALTIIGSVETSLLGSVTLNVGDLQIGAVEIKDAISANRAKVDTESFLFTRQGIPFYVASSTTMPSGVTTDLTSFTVPTGSTVYITSWLGASRATADYLLTINSVGKAWTSTTPVNPTTNPFFGAGIQGIAADVIKIQGHNQTSGDYIFNCVMNGYYI